MKRQFIIKGNMHVDDGNEARKAKSLMAEELINMGWDITSVEVVPEGED